jgi:hypothetical protein
VNEGDLPQAARLFQESLDAGGESLDPHVKVRALNNLGYAWATFGDRERGLDSLREALAIALELGDVFMTAGILESIASAAVERDAKLAARLLGAAHTVLEEMGVPLDASSNDEIRAALDEESFERAYAEGRASSLDEALAYVHSSLD